MCLFCLSIILERLPPSDAFCFVFHFISNLHIRPPQTLHRLEIYTFVHLVITRLQTSYTIQIYIIVWGVHCNKFSFNFQFSVTIDLVYTYILCVEIHGYSTFVIVCISTDVLSRTK